MAAEYQSIPLARRLRVPSPFRVVSRWICLPEPPTGLDHRFQLVADLTFCVTPSLITLDRRYRNIEPVSHQLRLSASPKGPTNPGRTNLPQEILGFRRTGFITRLIVTHVRIITSMQSTPPYGTASTRMERSSTTPLARHPQLRHPV